MTSFLSLYDAVAEYVYDGATIAMEGFTHLIPFAAGHEIIRQQKRDLCLIRMTPDLLYDQLIGMDCARKLVFSRGDKSTYPVYRVPIHRRAKGIIGVQKEAALAATKMLVAVEEIVDDLRVPSPNATILPNWTINAIVETPGGANPSYAHGYYGRNNTFYSAWDAISRNREAFLGWMREHVLADYMVTERSQSAKRLI